MQFIPHECSLSEQKLTISIDLDKRLTRLYIICGYIATFSEI